MTPNGASSNGTSFSDARAGVIRPDAGDRSAPKRIAQRSRSVDTQRVHLRSGPASDRLVGEDEVVRRHLGRRLDTGEGRARRLDGLARRQVHEMDGTRFRGRERESRSTMTLSALDG
jgi:hypothetical protein